jgi:hypothetical protein
MPARLPFLLVLLALACASVLPAQTVAEATPPASRPTAAEDPWLVTLAALLTTRDHANGTLVLDWNRPRPASAPADADLEVVDAPAELAPQLLIGVLATDSAGVRTRHTLVLRAELWRDGAALRFPSAVGSPLLLSDVEVRRYDALRERDALVLEDTAELDFARAVPVGWYSYDDFRTRAEHVSEVGLRYGFGWVTPAVLDWYRAAPNRAIRLDVRINNYGTGCLPVELVRDNAWTDIRKKPKWARR